MIDRECLLQRAAVCTFTLNDNGCWLGLIKDTRVHVVFVGKLIVGALNERFSSKHHSRLWCKRTPRIRLIVQIHNNSIGKGNGRGRTIVGCLEMQGTIRVSHVYLDAISPILRSKLISNKAIDDILVVIRPTTLFYW